LILLKMESGGARRPTLEDVCAALAPGVTREHVLGAVVWGSRVYGTCTQQSDWDVMVVVSGVASRYGSTKELCAKIAAMTAKEAVQIKSHGRTRGDVVEAAFGEVTVVPRQQWLRMLYEHRLEALEVLFGNVVLLPLAEEARQFRLDRLLLQAAAEWEAGRTLSRARRKLKEGDLKKGAKELFHALRYLCFARQIAEHGRIVDYSAANETWVEIAKCNGVLDVDRDWLPRYKIAFRALRQACGNVPQLCSTLELAKTVYVRNKLSAELTFDEVDFSATPALQWLRDVGPACLEDFGVSVIQSEGYLILSAFALRTKFVADYAPHLYEVASQLLVVACRVEGTKVKLVGCSSEPRLALPGGRFATPFSVTSDPQMSLLANPQRSHFAACAILSVEGGEVVDGVPQSEPLWLASNQMFIYLRAAPLLESATDCWALVKRQWPSVCDWFDFGPFLKRVELLADTIRDTGDKTLLGGANQGISGLVQARLVSRDCMFIKMIRAFAAIKNHSSSC
jgi:predicted nucleotidyltransferase